MKHRTTLEGAYNPADTEARWYDWWVEQGFFTADPRSDKPPFTIVIPPPNVTGSLHMGHALTFTIQDILTRWKRMSGYEALWLPGTDHAGIATQILVERMLRRQGITRHDLGREAFLEKVWEWKHKYGNRICSQLRFMGASVDWSRERFTMDEGLSEAVREVFVQLWEDGLIYRAERLVNWDPEGQTVLSNLEVEQEEEQGSLWHIAYPLSGDPSRHIVVATTRPETLLGDAAVAVHPDDERYKDILGQTVALPLTGRLIPILGDGLSADPRFGSGAVKITPAHDFNDWECGQRHNLPLIQVIGPDAKMTDQAPEKYRGLTREAAREAVLADLRELGLLVKVEPHTYMPGRSQRTGVIVEPLPMTQWFVKMKPLAEPAVKVVEEGRIKFVPEMWSKVYFDWMNNVRDWCISRQLWWGHRIPAWYCDDCGHIEVSRTDPTACSKCGGSRLRQDEDVLDTWFSSGLWPFSTMGWPAQTQDLAKFYPTDVMETGFDIIFFWVARMIFFGLHFMKEVPFKTVFLHAMVRDKHGEKMSKTKGNVVDPLHLIHGARPAEIPEDERAPYRMLFEDFPEGVAPQGADALRLTLAVYAAQGRDVRLDVKRVEGYRAFLNKLWNASKFSLMHLRPAEGAGWEPKPLDVGSQRLSPADRWILGRLQAVTQEVQAALDGFQLNEAAQALYRFVWNELCDWYIELSKPVLYGGAEAAELDGDQDAARTTLAHVLEQTLRLLHPITPYVTEEIWQVLPKAGAQPASLCVAAWPQVREEHRFAQETADMELAIALISQLRTIRSETGVKPSAQIPVLWLLSDDPAARAQLENVRAYLRALGRVERVELHPATGTERPAQSATARVSGVELYIPLAGLINLDEETKRLQKAIEKLHKDVAHVQGKLGNEKFVQNAPAELLEKERAKLDEFLARKAALERSLEELRG